ncbi:MAG: right-handed parallel beta-helix repeat-containing protein [Phycisphaerae bacterium]|nr:right-handed parallel beta-helix repeat-containing protein [Phycisphaerae bacterium]
MSGGRRISWRAYVAVFVVVSLVASARAGTLYVSLAGDDANDGQSWATAKRTVQTGLNAAVSGEQVWVAAGTYVENITLKDGVALYGAFAGNEDPAIFDLADRDFAANETILDGNSNGSVVTTAQGASETTRIDGFTIRNGIASSGGGICCSSYSCPTIANNTITANTASSSGGGICCSAGSFPMIANNTITGNTASSSGGGIYCASSSAPTIANNTIAGNSADSGGAICCDYYSSPTIANTIIAFNSSGVYNAGSGMPVLRHNCVFGDGDYDYSGITDPTGTDGNISADPRLASVVYGNVHIQPDSPCVDAGDNAYALGDYDMDGQPRIQPASGTVDIGADESDGTLWPEYPDVIVRVSPDGDDANDGSSWTQAKRTVQASIDAASAAGGDVWVRAGTYYERITLRPYAHIYGGFAGTENARDERDWATNETILDGRARGSVVSIEVGWQAGTIDGLTIRNGRAPRGGGIYCDSSSPMIANNTITGNTAFQYGSGIYCDSSSPMIANNTITGNTAFQYGGGIYCDSSSPTIANNTIGGNTASGDYASGGGVYCCSGSSPTIASNTIGRNTASYHGGGICCEASFPMIANNTIRGNATSGGYANGGGGIYCGYSSSPTIANNTIRGNTASGDYASGGGIYCNSSSPTIANNTVRGNAASGDYANGGGICCDSSSPTIASTIIAFNSSGFYRTGFGTPPILRHNCVFGNTSYDYSGITDPTGADGNTSADPRLASVTYDNLHIQPDSPCVDAGDNAYAFGDYDMDGQPRIQPVGGTVDIGADESDGTLWPEDPNVIVRVSPDGDDANDGSSWPQAKRTVQAGVDAASAPGGDVWVRAGTYYERITLRPYAHLYGGFAGAENVREDRDWATNETILDGQAGGSVVSIEVGWQASTIDGFTIRNGGASNGGGIYCDASSSPTIANNTITGNTASSSGGGVYCNNASPTIANNTIMGNTASSYGGAIYCSAGSSPMIANNTITGNTASSSGGGIYCGSSSSPTIANNTITGNTASSSGGGICCWSSSSMIANNTITGNIASAGGGICCGDSSPMIANNTITGNTANYSGGGIYCWSSSPMIANNTITGNTATGIYGGGGGIYCERSSSRIANNMITGNTATGYGGGIWSSYDSSPMIANNTITGNNAGSGGGIYCKSSSPTIANTIVAFNSSGISNTETGTPILRHNCVFGNAEYDYSGITDPTGTDGNLSADPLFVRTPDAGPDGVWGTTDDDHGDLHLKAGSPCVDGGDNTLVPVGAVNDRDGHPRIADGDGNGSAVVDMGAYEYPAIPPDFDFDGDVDLTDFGAFAACFNGPNRPPAPGCAVNADLDDDTDVDLSDFAIFASCFNGPNRPPAAGCP